MAVVSITPSADQRAYGVAFGLILFTIFHNLAGGAVSTWLGYRDETVALFGFGLDSLIEVVSGVGIAYLVVRLRRTPARSRRRLSVRRCE